MSLNEWKKRVDKMSENKKSKDTRRRLQIIKIGSGQWSAPSRLVVSRVAIFIIAGPER